MKSITPFDIVLVPFPFTSLTILKKRPALVLATVHPAKLPGHLVVAMITSQLDGVSFPNDVLLKEWGKAGLPKPSLVRLSKIVTLEESMIQKTIGKLTKKDEPLVRSEFKRLFCALV